VKLGTLNICPIKSVLLHETKGMFVAGDFNARPSEKFGPVLLAKESVRAGNTSSLSIPRHYGLINYSQLVKKNNQVRRLVIYLLNVYYEI